MLFLFIDGKKKSQFCMAPFFAKLNFKTALVGQRKLAGVSFCTGFPLLNYVHTK